MKKYLRYIEISSIVILCALVYKNWLNPFALNLGFDLSYAFEPLTTKIHGPYIWVTSLIGDGFGGYGLNTLWSYPVRLFYQTLLLVHIPFNLQMKYLAVLPFMTVAYIGFKKLKEFYEFDNVYAWLLYILNTYFLLILDGGQVNLVITYLLIPLGFYFYRKAVIDFIHAPKFIFVVWLIGAFDLRVTFLLGFILLVHFAITSVLERKTLKKTLVNFISLGAISLLALFFLNFFWIYPSLVSRTPALPAGHETLSNVFNLSFTKISHAVSLFQPHWYRNSFGMVRYPSALYFVIPFFVVLAFVFSKHRKALLPFGILAISSIFFVKGANYPFPSVYPWLFEHVIFFKVFRDSSKFFIPLAFAYSVLFGSAIHTFKNNRKTMWVPFVSLCIFVLMAMPIITGKMTGTFSPVYLRSEVESANKTISNDGSFSRTLWLPSKHALGYVSELHPGVGASDLVGKRAFQSSVIGSYEVFNFLRDSEVTPELLDISSISYVTYPFPDSRREILKPDNIEYYNTFHQQLKNANWAESEVEGPPVVLIHTKNHQDRFFSTAQTYYTVGSDRLLFDLEKENLLDLSETSFVWAEKSLKNFSLIGQLPADSKILFYKKDSLDLAMTNISQENFIFPSAYLKNDPDESGWWKRSSTEFLNVRSFLQQKYDMDTFDFDFGGGWAFAEGDLKKEISSSQFEKGKSLYARVMFSTKSGDLAFYQDSTLIGSTKTHIEIPDLIHLTLHGWEEIPDTTLDLENANFKWVKIGELKSDAPLTIASSGVINSINSLAVVDEATVTETLNSIELLKKEGRIVNWTDLDAKEKETLFKDYFDKPNVSYVRHDPTHYTLTVENVDQPTTVVFSETYDPYWELNGEPAYEVYGLFNGFTVKKDGTYEIVITTQKYVDKGFIVSVVAFFILMGSLFAISTVSKKKVK